MRRLSLIPFLLACALPATATETVALPGGAMLALDKHGLHLRAADGAERARIRCAAAISTTAKALPLSWTPIRNAP